MIHRARVAWSEFLHKDDGNMPSAAVFVVVLALIVATTATAVATTSASTRSATLASEKRAEQIAASNARLSASTNHPEVLSQGTNTFYDNDRANTYRVGSSNSFLGLDPAGQPVWDDALTAVPHEFVQFISTGTLNCGLTKPKPVGGNVYCWGTTTGGLGGNGSANFSSNTPKKTATTVANGFTQLLSYPDGLCGVEATTNFLWCWGANPGLSLGTTATRNVPTKLGTYAMKTGAGTTNTFAASTNTMCMVTSTDKLVCNGVMDANATTSTIMKIMKNGATDISAKSVFVTDNTVLILAAANQMFGLSSSNLAGAPGVTGASTAAITVPTAITKPAGVVNDIHLTTTAAGDSALMLLDQKLHGFGRVWKGDGTARIKSDTSVPVAATMNFKLTHQAPAGTVCAVTTTNENWCWGTGTKGALGNGGAVLSTSPVRQNASIAAYTQFLPGPDHTLCAINTSLWCWGDNANGNTGHPTAVDVRTPYNVGYNLPVITAGASSSTSTCALTNLKHLWCWGNNTGGNLGVGHDLAITLQPTQLTEAPEANLVTTIKRGG